MLIAGAITGQPALGLALALVRRARVIFWILLGFALGWRYAFHAKIVAAEFTDAADPSSAAAALPLRRVETASGDGDGSLR